MPGNWYSSEMMNRVDSNFNFIIGVYDQTSDRAPNHGAHSHPFDELLLFFGYDDNDLSYQGFKINMNLGKEHEKHTFDVPTVVSIPRETPCFPAACNRVDKPYCVTQVGLAAKQEAPG